MHGSREESPSIVLAGFMGTGKSSIGRALAGMLGLDFIDTDEEIERSTGQTIQHIFEHEGEARFREMEAALCTDVMKRRGMVIATGGGTFIDRRNADGLAESARVVLLECPVEELARRLERNSSRPLLSREGTPLVGAALAARIRELLAERTSAYERITHRLDTTGLSPGEAAARLCATLEPRYRSMVVRPLATASDGETARGRFGESRIDVGRGMLSRIGVGLRELGIDTHAFLLMPDSLRPLFADQVTASLESAGIPSTIVSVRDGDADKHLDQAAALVDRLLAAGARRDATIIPVGGGVTGDLGGFVASMLMRGVPLVHAPTTLLAQVDSSIGGKVGVNHPLAKNVIGSFYQPHLVVTDPATLRSLPPREIANGMAEVIKTALIGSKSLFEYIEAQAGDGRPRALRAGDRPQESTLRGTAFLERCVIECAEIKCRIVNSDPYERNQRRLLNLGHTAGHALEAAGGYGTLKHGEAVSLGLVAAMRIAVARGAVDREVLDRTSALLAACGLPVAPTGLDLDAVARSLKLDKKIRNGKLHFVLPTGIGAATVVDDVTEHEILATISGERK